MLLTAVKGTAGVFGEQQQKCIQSSVFVCNNLESQFCFQKMEDAAINKYRRIFFCQRASFFSIEDHFLFTLIYSSPALPPPEAYAVYFYAFPSEFPDFPEIESSAG